MGLDNVRLLLAQAAGEKAASGGGGLNINKIVTGAIESGVYVLIGIVVFSIAFFLMTKIAPFSIRKEIEEDQNTALGVLMGAVIIGLAIIIAAAID